MVGGLAVDDDQFLVFVNLRTSAANVIAIRKEPWPEKQSRFGRVRFMGNGRQLKLESYWTKIKK